MYSVSLRLVLFVLVNQILAFTIPSHKLNSGYEMPMIAFGTFNISSDVLNSALMTALETGYRHIYCAFIYENESLVGDVLRKWLERGGKREDLFITSKLPPQGNRPSDVSRFLNNTLKNLGLDYLDMYLLHFPFSFESTDDMEPATHPNGSVIIENVNFVSTWKEMEKQVRTGKVKSIGMSNFNSTQMLRLWKEADIKPSNLQIEYHVYLQQEELIKLSESLNIAVTGFNIFGFGNENSVGDIVEPLKNPNVLKIAAKINRTPAQVLLRYAIQKNITVVTKSKNSKRMTENMNLFDFFLNEREMKALDSLDQHGRYRRFNGLYLKGIEKSPEFPFGDTVLNSQA